MLAMIDPGDEVIFLDPYFVAYKHILTVTGGNGHRRSTATPTFASIPISVEKAITPRTKVLLLNSPSNPTGIVMTQAEVHSRSGIWQKSMIC